MPRQLVWEARGQHRCPIVRGDRSLPFSTEGTPFVPFEHTTHCGTDPPPSVRYGSPALGSLVPGGQVVFGRQSSGGAPGGQGGISAHFKSLGYLIAGSQPP
jgi:hypothetical protein